MHRPRRDPPSETPVLAQRTIGIATVHLGQPGVRAALGELEAEIMEAVWRRPAEAGTTVREIWDELYPRRPVMYTTVMNTMTRLAKKGLLIANRKERAFVYRPALSREAFVEQFVGEALQQLLVNFGGATVAHLQRTLGPLPGTRLARLLAAAEQGRPEQRQG